ncbi:shikimate kinase [Neobacillus sp. NRS-1170]|uniref:shikimate kinase n=1 Tax=Neobacillus sp. NRS-1170 TaxID=3233898 RepID=UPI003D2D6539
MNIDRENSIVFIGFMGAGKTTIGKLVAEKLNREFIDIDEEIEKEFNMPVTQIFKEFGEKAFRDREKSLITSLSQQKNLIISVGGGAFLQEEIKKVCLFSSIVIFLDISFESWKERISQIIDSRPVLQGKSIEEMQELFNNRQKVYADHHFKIQTDNKNPVDIANQIIEKILN